MKGSSRVIQNSLWIGIQPLVLNVVSIFATAYIVRGISQEDYGHFVLAFNLVALLTPLCALGMRSVLVRDAAGNREGAPRLFGQVLSLRLLLATVTYGIAVVVVNALDYPTTVKVITYIACTTLFFNSIANHLMDTFQAFERMKYIAYGNLISGSTLTIVSVLAIMLGFGVLGLTISYVVGPIVLVLLMLFFYARHLPRFRLEINGAVWRDLLKKGFPFFAVGIVWIFAVKIGIVMLSKMSGDEEVAVFGAATGLVQRLVIVPESLGTALYPAVAALIARGGSQEIGHATQKAFDYLLIVGVACAVGMGLLAEQAMSLVYGANYGRGGVVLAISAAYVPLWFFVVLFNYCLGAIKKQNAVLASVSIASVISLAANFLLIPRFGAAGLAASTLLFYIVCFAGVLIVVHRNIPFSIRSTAIGRVLFANILMGVAVYYLRSLNLVLAILVPALVYGAALVVMRVLTMEDLERLLDALRSRRQHEEPAPEQGDMAPPDPGQPVESK
jgi:O-antigen/teichoic acid export membrane protein